MILWLGLNPWRAPIRLVFPPERAPRGRAPVGVNPFNCSTCSDSSLRINENEKYTQVQTRLPDMVYICSTLEGDVLYTPVPLFFSSLKHLILDIRNFEWALITWELRRPSPSFRSPWSCSWSPLSFVELDLNSEDRLTKTPLAAPGSSTTHAHQQTDWVGEIVFHKGILRHLLVRIIYTMEEKVSQSRLLSWHRKRKTKY